ncbi:histone deacetylase 6 isoform X3 [Sitodiplosis mosellana]|uniref:histone deacetylase 6 isoform X3 n=1 Tax=Sitodiplosis mosellana TaxID=263140 RepID=UPI002443C7F2|nr:histone deacetylase 6 isoform X3 [Sitodiplosis mosellana]
MSTSQILTRGATQRSKIQTRAMVNKDLQNKQQAQANNISAAATTAEGNGKKSQITLNEAKKKARNSATKSTHETLVKDIYQNALSSLRTKRGKTGLVYDRRMAQHCCLWDNGYPESPERFTRVLERCEELHLIDRCHPIESRPGTLDEILMKHTQEQYDILKATENETDESKLEELSSHYDAIYIHPTTFQLSKLAVGSTIELVDSILRNDVQNGMAIIRPPGHHAMKAEYNGYCFFNNVAIAAQHALVNRGINRILIVDYDVHHGQGTQRMFYDDPRVLYFSIHRYEHGTFWPNLRESDFDCIGVGSGLGYNFNLPLNKTGMTNADYLAIWQQILLPVAAEYQPNLVIISAGYDAAFGCPEGEMEITPACYAHLVSPLMAIAQGRVAVVLEGGYCLDSLAEGAAITLKTILGDPCPLLGPLAEPSESIVESILNCIHSHRNYWKCLQMHKTYELEELKSNRAKDLHLVEQKFIGSGEPIPERFETRNCYPVHNSERLRQIATRLQRLKITTNLSAAPNRVCYVYDSQMAEHRNLFEEHYERPERITKIKETFAEYNLLDRMHGLKSREASTEELCLIHTYTHVKNMRKISIQNKNMQEIGDKYNSIYFHETTFKCATMAVGSVLEVVDNVLNGNYQKGLCVVRPPGHHAEAEFPHGFCIFNNVALAAKYAIKFQGLKRVLIIDWDIHHGNGTQRMFENEDKVLYISLHRYENGDFFPKSTDGDYMMVGEGRGEGFNVNIPWNKHKMGDSDYIAAFQRIIMPIAYEFNPELVLVSAGFDAVVGDPIGHYHVTPEAYGYFTHWLSSLANGKIVLCLEGGYNVNSISHAMTMCTKALLGDPLPMLHTTGKAPSASCMETIQNVCSVHRKYWKSLRFDKKLPAYDSPSKDNTIDEVVKQLDTLTCSDESSSNPSSSKQLEPQPGPSTSASGSSGDKKQTLTEYLKENRDALLNEDMFAVVPLSDCPHLATLDPDSAPEAFDTKSSCQNCDTVIENWVCLLCFKTCCSRYIQEHMLFHHIETEHALALSYSDLSVWCFKCENYIDNPILYKYKNLAHRNKFGEDMVWCYDPNPILLDTIASSS